MKASEINKRARSLADMPNADFITYEDEKNSLNESWKDIYSQITDSSDDYFVETATLSMAGYKVDENTWEIPLPVDMYKLRTVDFFNGKWQVVKKFSLNARNLSDGPYYRFKDNKLWITSVQEYSLRISYYPPPMVVTLPDVTVTYNEDLTNVYSIWEDYAVENRSIIINTDDENIYLIKENDATPENIYDDGTLISYPLYYKNNILFIDENSLYMLRPGALGITNPALLVADIDPSVYRPSIVRDVYYYVNVAGDKTKYFNLKTMTGGDFDVSQLYDCLYVDTSDQRYYLSTNVYGITSLMKNFDTIVSQGVEMFSYPFFSVDQTIYRLAPDDTFTEWGTGSIGYNGKDYIITGDPETGAIKVIGNAEDTSFDYPLNIVPEIMAYSAAVDYTRKAQGDATLIKARLNELWQRFQEVLIRDDYSPEVINNEFNTINRRY